VTASKPGCRWFLFVCGGSLAILLTLALLSSWVCDDAYIIFRYSRNFAEGLGLRFNVGVEPPVEGYTELGWVLWMGIIEALDLDPRLWSRATGIAAAAALLLWLTWFARRRLGLGALPTAAAALFFATAPTVVVWSTGGLGTMVFALAIFAVAERLLGDPDRPRGGQALAAALLAALLRADGVYWLGLIFAMGIALALKTQRRTLLRHTLACAAITAAAIAVHVLWRLHYHGDWLPNTARVKVGLSWPFIQRGFDYLFTYWLAIPATLLVVVSAIPLARRSGEWWLRTCVVMAAGTFAYGVLVGGDFMTMGRFFLPAMAFLALAVGVLTDRLERWKGTIAATAAVAILLVGSIPALFDAHLTPQSWREATMFRWGMKYQTEYRFWRGMIVRAGQWAQLGRALAIHTEAGESIVQGAIGAIGYHSNLFIYDQMGLVNRDVIQRLEADPDHLAIPGHDRVAPKHFFSSYSPTYAECALRYVGNREKGSPGMPPRIRRLLESRPKGKAYPISASEGFQSDGYLIVWRF